MLENIKYYFFYWLQALFIRVLPASFARKVVLRKNQVDTLGDSSAFSRPRQLLLDVSVLIRSDAGTGIQRVVRNVWEQLELLLANDPNISLKPVYASKQRVFRYVSENGGLPEKNSRVEVKSGDFFLGLDLSADALYANTAGLLSWKNQGVSLHFVLYDRLPMSNPEWFTRRAVKKFKKWFRLISIYGDQVLCISKTVKFEAENFLNQMHMKHLDRPKLVVFSLGGDFRGGSNSEQKNKQVTLLNQQDLMPFVLMVGTIEPRKGHDDVVGAFELLWRRGNKTKLVIVGRVGWGTKALQERLRSLESNGLLKWLDNVEDEDLEQFYDASLGVIVASKGEGYGLPVIEGLTRGKKLLVRDLAVFRELSHRNISFFRSDCSILDLATKIEMWIPSKPKEVDMFRIPTWSDSASKLLWALKNNE